MYDKLIETQFDSEIEAMKAAWDSWKDENGIVRCRETGERLWFSPVHCAHILPKGSYGKFRYRIDNMIPLSFEAHRQFDQGDRSKMKIWPEIEDKILSLKQEYFQ